MTKLRVINFAVSLDGYGAGVDQTLDDPLGTDGERLHEWAVQTKWFGGPGSPDGIDDRFIDAGFESIGATIMGRNMYGPVRGEWGEDMWTGWWGSNPPYHHPTFVLTHHAHDPIEMEGGTTFHFVTDGIESAFEQATAAAAGQDIRLGGGVSTIQQYLDVGLVDDMHLAVVPILLGAGERLLDRTDRLDGFGPPEIVASTTVTHLTWRKA